jgi:outer membrane receptor for ferrienterochelin and colicins
VKLSAQFLQPIVIIMHCFRLRDVALFIGAVAWAGSARADSPSASPGASSSELEAMLQESVVSTPTTASAAASTAPAVTSTISSEDLLRYGIRSLAEAINFLSVGMVSQESLIGGREQVGARGVMLLNNSQVLVLLNGHVINDQHEAAAAFLGLGNVPLEMVDHIEIMLGPGSVLYGGNAMLGVINVVTKRASQYTGARAVTEWSFVPPQGRRVEDGGLASRHAVGGGARFDLWGVPGELTLQAQYTQNRRPTFEYGPPERVRRLESSLVSPNATARLVLGNLDATFYVRESTREESPRSDVPTRTDGRLGAVRYDTKERQANLDVVYRQRLATRLAFKGRLFGDVTRSDKTLLSYDGIYSCPQPLVSGCTTDTIVLTPSAGIELQATYDWTSDGSTQTMIGVMGVSRHLVAAINSAGVEPGATVANDLYLDKIEYGAAAYLQQIVKAGDALTFNGGIRADHASRFGDKLSPRLAAVYTPWKSASVKAIYSEAFRGPNIVESFFYHPSLLIKAGHLEPETVRSAEVAFEQRVGTHRFSYGMFRTWWSDLVQTRYYEDYPGSPPADAQVVRDAILRGELNFFQHSVLRYENIASTDNYGATAGFDGRTAFGRWQYGANVTMAQALSGTGPIAGAPRLIGNAHISHDWQNGLPVIALASSVSSRRGGRYGDAYPTELRVRLTLSGPIAGGLSYRVMGDYAVHDKSTAGSPTAPEMESRFYELLPSDRLTVMAGLQLRLFE